MGYRATGIEASTIPIGCRRLQHIHHRYDTIDSMFGIIGITYSWSLREIDMILSHGIQLLQ